MASRPLQTGAVALPRAIDYYFGLSLYLLVLVSFGMLASTGGLDLPSVILVCVALAARGFLLARGLNWIIPERWTTPLSLGYFLFFAIDYFLFSRSFLTATVHLALFGVVIRMFSVRRERDHITLAILAFLMVLASAVLTVDSVFLFSFAAFMLMAVVAFVLMEMRRAGQAATIQARHSTDPQEHRRFAFALAKVAPALMFSILIGAAGLFFVMPRISAGYLGGYSFGNDFSTGFSDHVRLGQIGQIQRSNAVVMHVRIAGDTSGRYEIHWRGVSLANFDGQGWSNPPEQYLLQRGPDGSFPIPRSASNGALRFYVTSSLPRENLIRYRVLMEPIGTNLFFLAPEARAVRGDYRLLAADSGGAIYDFDPQHPVTRYEAASDIATPSLAELRAAGHHYPAELAAIYLRLPAVDPRIPRLAAQITNSAHNDFDKTAAVEHYLKTHFTYTLSLSRTTPKDPIANFLFERKQGHCEYFASAMAVMLRTLGIPSRVVNGFRSAEFNDITGNYVVRAKDAHSWVEAYFPGYGWQTFDPTPAGAVGVPQGWSRISLYIDAMASFWRDWIVSYDTSHQYVLGRAAINRTRNLWQSARTWARRHYASMLDWAKHTQDRVQSSPAHWLVFGAVMALALLLMANLGRVVRWLRDVRLRAHPDRSPAQAASIWYERMARIVARHGAEKTPAQTPQEFVRIIEQDRLRAPISRFTEAYESARFGNSAEDAQRLPELYREVESAVCNC